VTETEPDFSGSAGRAWKLEVWGPQAAATVCHFLITAPVYHPLWYQYDLAVIRLGSFPGLPAAHLQFPGATHELMVMALNPETGHGKAGHYPEHHTPECMNGEHVRKRNLSFLEPGNVAWQVIAGDAEMEQLAGMAVQAVVDGKWNPETADAPDAIRAAWNAGLTRTLAHLRGEIHAPGDSEPLVDPSQP
jgi:hypothetical protein